MRLFCQQNRKWCQSILFLIWLETADVFTKALHVMSGNHVNLRASIQTPSKVALYLPCTLSEIWLLSCVLVVKKVALSSHFQIVFQNYFFCHSRLQHSSLSMLERKKRFVHTTTIKNTTVAQDPKLATDILAKDCCEQ